MVSQRLAKPSTFNRVQVRSLLSPPTWKVPVCWTPSGLENRGLYASAVGFDSSTFLHIKQAQAQSNPRSG